MKLLSKVCAGLMSALLLGTAPAALAAEENAEEAQEAAQEAAQESTAETPAETISINVAANSLALLKNGEKIRLYPIATGKPSTPTPTGYYKILTKEINPTWIDPADPEYSIPSGDSNPLGFRWMQFHGNYGIHGTNKPDSIGHYVSNGCIRMEEKDVETLFDLVEVGTPVEITYNRIVVEKAPDNTVVYYIYPDSYGWQDITAKDVDRWLAGYGVSNFVSNEEIAQKIEASDGEPTYIAKVYPLYVDGQKLRGKAVVQEGVTYLPAVDLAEAVKISLGWKPSEKILTSTYGQAVGYDKKGVLYINADDAQTLFHIDGAITSPNGASTAAAPSSDEITIVKDGKAVEDPKAEAQAAAKELRAEYHSTGKAVAEPARKTAAAPADAASTDAA